MKKRNNKFTKGYGNMKKVYVAPAMVEEQMQFESIICQSPIVRDDSADDDTGLDDFEGAGLVKEDKGMSLW